MKEQRGAEKGLNSLYFIKEQNIFWVRIPPHSFPGVNEKRGENHDKRAVDYFGKIGSGECTTTQECTTGREGPYKGKPHVDWTLDESRRMWSMKETVEPKGNSFVRFEGIHH